MPVDKLVTQPLAIVGASARAAAASARRAGFEPTTADLFADEDLRRRGPATRIDRYPAGLLDWLRETRPPAWMYTGALENYPDLVDAMVGVAPLVGNGGDVLRRIRSPHELAAALREAGLLFPETRDSADGLPRDGSWLAKTYRGSSGSGVRALMDASLAPPLSHGGAVGCRAGVVFQRRVEGLPCAAVFVAAAGRAAILGVTRQLVGQAWLAGGEFQYAGSIGPAFFAPDALHREVSASITRIGQVLADRFGLAGLFGVDLVIDGHDVWTIEVNPRYTASVEIIERATGASALAAHVAACHRGWLGSSDAWLGSSRRRAPSEPGVAFGKAILFAKHNVVIGGELAKWALGEALVEPWPRLADVPAAGTRIAAGRPVMTVFADGKNTDDVLGQLRERAADVQRQLGVETA